MAKFDSENLLDEVLAIMNGGALNAKINEIEAEKVAQSKGLTPTLKQVAATSYHLQTWSEKMLQSSPAIFYGLEDVSSLENGFGLAKTYKIFVEIVLVDSGNSSDGAKRISRYARALEELFQSSEAARKFNSLGCSQLKIESVRPISFKLELDSSEEIKVGGISLTTTLF